jgi:hypothetical protein
VTAGHVALTRSRVGVAGSRAYNVFSDFNGDGRVNVTDLEFVRRRVGTTLPPLPQVAPAGAAPRTRARPGVRELFSGAPVLG